MTIASPMTAADIDAAGGDPTARTAILSRLRFDLGQTLTDAQKAQGQANLGAYGLAHVIFANAWPGIDPTNTVNCTNAWYGLIAYAKGREIRCDGGTYWVENLFVGDDPLNIVGATFRHVKGKKVMLVRRTVGDPQPVSAVSLAVEGVATANPPTPLNMTKVAVANAHLFARDDIVSLCSQDRYPWCAQYGTEQGFGSYSNWLHDLVRVSGLGVDFTGPVNGGFSQGDIITGATSGATGRVHGANFSDLGRTSGTLILFGLNAELTPGENLLVNGAVRGVVKGSAYVLLAELLTYLALYKTNVTLRKQTVSPCRLSDCGVIADGDIDSIVGAANRDAAFVFEGGAGLAIYNFRARSAWSRALRIQSCWKPLVSGLQIDRLPNNANPSESAYGYGIDVAGATAYGIFERLSGGNARHAITDNQDGDVNGDNYAARGSHVYDGVVKRNICRNSYIVGNISEPFDTHPGGIFWTFENCTAAWGDGTGLNISGAGGFKSRGFGTRYINCRSIGGTIGFNEYNKCYDAGFPYTTHYINCEAQNYSRNGFAITQAPFTGGNNQSLTVYDNCWVRHYGSVASLPYYPYGFESYYGGTNVVMRNCGSEIFVGAPWVVRGSQQLAVLDHFYDYTNASAANSSPPRYEGIPSAFMMSGVNIKRHPTNPNGPAAVLRNMTALAALVHIEGVRVFGTIVSGIAEVPLFLESGDGTGKVGKLTQFYRRDGKYVVVAQNPPAGPSPVDDDWPVGATVEFPVPDANGNTRAVCTVKGGKTTASATWLARP